MIINMNGAKAPETPSPVLQEKTVTPETLPTVIGADEGYDGLSQVTVNPDAQLKAENIRSGKSIFGVAGVFEGEPVYTEIDSVYAAYLGDYSLKTASASAPVAVTNLVKGEVGANYVTISVDKPNNNGINLLKDNRFTFINDKIPNVFSGSLMTTSYPITISADTVTITRLTFRPGNYQNIRYKAGTPLSGTLVGGLAMTGSSQYFAGVADMDAEENITYEITGTLQYDISANQPPSMVEFNIVLDTPIVFQNPSITGYFTSPSQVNSWYPNFRFYITKCTVVIG